MIDFKNCSVVYEQDIFALRNINCSINAGDFLFVLGPSGAGKTTFLRLIYRDLIPKYGDILINGIDLKRLPRTKLPFLRRKIGIVFQDFKLIEDRTVYENIEFAMLSIETKQSVINRRIPEILRILKLAGKEHLFPKHLSGGEQQRVAIARAVVNSPLILIADEPTGNLDEQISIDIIHEFRELNLLGMTVIVATHNERLRDIVTNSKMIHLKDGMIV